MINLLLRLFSLAFILGSGMPVRAQTASPYPRSSLITDVIFHFNEVRTSARGSDIWPATWAADDRLYTAWGDGNGFSGPKKVSWGLACLDDSAGQWAGRDIFYGPPGVRQGKVSGLLALGDTLYAWKNEQNGKYPLCDIRLIRSTDRGRSWSGLPVVFGPAGFKPVSFVNFGQGYTGARDHNIYIAGFNSGDTLHRIYLLRADRDSLEYPAAYECLSGLDRRRRPSWNRNTASLYPVFSIQDTGEANPFPVIIYNAGLKRYLLTDCHGPAGCIGIFEAPEPWGPWKTVYYSDHWGGLNKGEYLGFEFPNKWSSHDGKQLRMVFSVYNSDRPDWNDACNTIPVTFTISPAGR
ncbi:hypothetical protein [Compostibacter hankyongensis]|uniref:DUF4185 domain-containing protein n=1 Tax=Compostibacter hankyongensis TaxID=1007089 RepID=A0ABP8FQA3_9BACT